MENIDKLYQILIRKFNQNHPEEDLSLIEKAFNFAATAHSNQKRLSGDPYIIHPLQTAITVAGMNLDQQTIAASLLHDTIEDTDFDISKIKKDFGEQVAFLVEGVTKLGKIKYRGVQRQIESLRKMFLAMAEDIRVVIIKMADRLNNMETLQHLPKEKQQRIAKETMEIYVPIADRLGIQNIKGSLEDLSFMYLYPTEYKKLLKKINQKTKERVEYLKKVKPIIEKELEKEKIHSIDIYYRAKNYYSVYKKLEKYEGDINKIYDLVAMRIVVPTIEQCYAVLGIIHKLWKPLPGRIKDYIALPKPNGYQSIHTTVWCIDGKMTEIQIRTPDMQREAEFGIAAHWAYKEKNKDEKINARKLEWINQLRDWQKGNPESKDFINNLKIDFFKNRIFVFTPRGEVMDLPEGATPIDFAYHIHSDIGNQCQSAKVNNKMVSLDHNLKNGDVVEIITNKNKKPNPDWIRIIKTNYAKSKIRSYFKKEGEKEPTSKKNLQKIELRIIVKDRIGLLKEITEIFGSLKINIQNLNTQKESLGLVQIIVSFIKKDKLDLKNLINKINAVKGVKKITHKELWA